MATKTMRDRLDELLLFHEHVIQHVQQQMHQQMQQQLQAAHQHIEQLRAHAGQMQQQLAATQQQLAATQQQLAQAQATAANVPPTTKNSEQAVEIEVEVEVGEEFYVVETEVIPVSRVNVYELLPGSVVPVEEVSWTLGRLSRGSGLDEAAYVKIEQAVNAAVKKAIAKMSG